jgi:hypothetical protein
MAIAAGRVHPNGGTRRDEGRLERSDERPEEQAALVQPDDGIGDQLARTVIGHFAATLDPLDRDAPSRELSRAREDVRGVGLATQGQDRGMLQEQQLVGDLAGRSLVDQPTLEGVRIGVVDSAQPAGVQRRAIAGSVPGERVRPGIDQGRLHARTIAGAPVKPVG